MIHRRGVLPVLVLLVLVLLGTALQIVRGSSAASPSARPTPAPTAVSGTAHEVLASLAAVERAYDAGNVGRLCRPGVLVDPAVIRAQGAGCESRLESLMASKPRLRLTVRSLALRPDLATVTVTTASGSSAAVDFVRRGKTWLLSFSDGADPLPALAGTT